MDKTNIIDLIKKIGEAASNMPKKTESLSDKQPNSEKETITIKTTPALQKGLVSSGQIAKPQKKTLTKQAIIDLIVRHNTLSKQIDDKIK